MTASQHVGRSYREAVCTQEKHIGKIPRSLGLATANGETWGCFVSLCPLKMSSLNCRLRITNCSQSLTATVEIHVDWVQSEKELGRSRQLRACPFFPVDTQEAVKQQFPKFGACCSFEISKKVCSKCTIPGSTHDSLDHGPGAVLGNLHTGAYAREKSRRRCIPGVLRWFGTLGKFLTQCSTY